MIEREVDQRQTVEIAATGGRTLLDMNAYQWTVLFAAWLGWGFDIFDSLLFNYVAPNAVPVLLEIPLGTAEARAATLRWTRILTSLLLIGWAVGGIFLSWTSRNALMPRLLSVLLSTGSVASMCWSNAASFYAGYFEELSPEQFERQLSVSLIGVHGSRAWASTPYFPDSGSGAEVATSGVQWRAPSSAVAKDVTILKVHASMAPRRTKIDVQFTHHA